MRTQPTPRSSQTSCDRHPVCEGQLGEPSTVAVGQCFSGNRAVRCFGFTSPRFLGPCSPSLCPCQAMHGCRASQVRESWPAVEITRRRSDWPAPAPSSWTWKAFLQTGQEGKLPSSGFLHDEGLVDDDSAAVRSGTALQCGFRPRSVFPRKIRER